MGVPGRDLPVRRIRFGYPQGSLRKHYVDGDLVMSHVVAVLSATFPPGEDFFVRSVRHYGDAISGNALKEQVRGFIGQESPTAGSTASSTRASRTWAIRPTGCPAS